MRMHIKRYHLDSTLKLIFISYFYPFGSFVIHFSDYMFYCSVIQFCDHDLLIIAVYKSSRSRFCRNLAQNEKCLDGNFGVQFKLNGR